MSLRLADAIFWIAVACFTVAQIAILHSAVVSPTRPAGSEPASSLRRAGEIAWAVLPGLALAAILVFTWRAMHVAPVDGTVALSLPLRVQ